MTDLRQRISDVLCNRLADLDVAGGRFVADNLAETLMALDGIAIVDVPAPDERLPVGSVLCQWLGGDVSTVRGSQRVHLEDHRLSATEAHAVAAALLAAAVQAQEPK